MSDADATTNMNGHTPAADVANGSSTHPVDNGELWSIGIDLGTQVCSAALIRDGTVIHVSFDEEQQQDSSPNLLLPSFVSATGSDFLVGADARKRARSGDPSTVFDFVRLVGRKIEDLSSQNLLCKWPFKVVPGENDKAMIEISATDTKDGASTSTSTSNVIRTFHPEELVAALIMKIKQKAEALVSAKVESTVICVPGGFNHTQRRAVRNACVIAGLRVEKILSAATAAATSFRMKEQNAGTAAGIPTQVVLAVDVGASSTDISLVSVLANKFEVKAADSNLDLGGDDFTERIATHCRRKKSREEAAAAPEPGETVETTSSQTHGYSKGASQVRQACELAKKLLSSSENAVVGIDFPAPDTFGYYTVTRSCFEALCEDLWQSLLEKVHRVIHESSVVEEDINAVLLMGGSSQIPRLQTLFKESFPSQQVVVARHYSSPNVSAARGAALVAGAKQGLSSDTQSLPSIELTEVTPLSLGIQSVGGTRIVMIPQNTRLPVHKSFLYYASCQNAVVVHVVEGRSFNRLNESAGSGSLHRLASIRVDGSRATRHLVLKIDITFEISSLDQMVVTAVERSSGRKVTTVLGGDETCLAPNAIAHANARLYHRIEDSTAMVLVPRHSVLQIPHLTGTSLLSTEDPIQLLEEYIQALEVAIESDKLGSTLSREDKALVSAVGSTLSANKSQRRHGSSISSEGAESALCT